MGWLMDYIRNMSLIDYANQQRHKMEHPEGIPKVKKNSDTIGGIPRDVYIQSIERDRKQTEELFAEIRKMNAEIAAKKAKEVAENQEETTVGH